MYRRRSDSHGSLSLSRRIENKVGENDVVVRRDSLVSSALIFVSSTVLLYRLSEAILLPCLAI